jgi:hypothetical protein
MASAGGEEQYDFIWKGKKKIKNIYFLQHLISVFKK